MRRIALLFAAALLVSCSSSYRMTWSRHVMDGHRCGVSIPNADNVREAVGSLSGEVYSSPSGNTFKGGTTPEVARILIDAQPQMVHLKEVIGYSDRVLKRYKPECELGDMIADALMAEVSALSGRKVDVSFLNTGGVRTDMPQGDILLDDIVSMLPFNNRLCYLTLKGMDLRAIYEFIASGSPQIFGGARICVENHRLLNVEIGGEPLEDDRVYGVATTDFLLDGGDGMHVARNAVELVMFDELPSVMLEKYIRAITAEGRTVNYSKDGRIIWK